MDSPQIIGVCGYEHNSGTTHLCLSLANYLCNKRLAKTAYIELNPSDQISSLKNKDCRTRFSHYHIDFFPNSTLSSYNNILSGKHQYYVIDFGVLNINTLNDFMRCDIKFAICSLSPWKTTSLTKFLNLFIDNNVNIEKDITLLGYPVESKPYNKEISEMPQEIYCIPYLQNPFHITSGYFNFFEMILQRKKIYHAKRQKF